MKTKKVNCIICGVETEVPVINEPWCDYCVGIEDVRSKKEDYVGNFTFKRLPKYLIAKEDWPNFGY